MVVAPRPWGTALVAGLWMAALPTAAWAQTGQDGGTVTATAPATVFRDAGASQKARAVHAIGR